MVLKLSLGGLSCIFLLLNRPNLVIIYPMRPEYPRGKD